MQVSSRVLVIEPLRPVPPDAIRLRLQQASWLASCHSSAQYESMDTISGMARISSRPTPLADEPAWLRLRTRQLLLLLAQRATPSLPASPEPGSS